MPFPFSGDLPDPWDEQYNTGMEPVLQADSLLSEPQRKPLLWVVSINFVQESLKIQGPEANSGAVTISFVYPNFITEHLSLRHTPNVIFPGRVFLIGSHIRRFGRRAWQPTPVFLPGEFSWTEKPGGLQSLGLQRVRHDWVTKHTHIRRLPFSS